MKNKKIRQTITFSCEPEFKETLMDKVEELGYQNTSQMIRDALQYFFENEESLNKLAPETIITVIISVVYNHHNLNTVQKFIEVQHICNVSFSTHFHLSHDECLENLILTDNIEHIKKLLQRIRAIEGLKYISTKIVFRPEYKHDHQK